ncbi:MAG TPA: thioredoxin domain-containing protein [Pyrinomonadaceae bacterium]|jgi:protein-disulfide isomerase
MSKKRDPRQPQPKPRPQTKQPPPPSKNYLPLAIIAVVLVAAAAGGAWLWRAARPAPAAGALAKGAPGAQPARAEGPEGAPLVLEEFGDYQCPPCGQYFPEVERLKAEYGDRLRLVFRHFPLTQAHQHALAAAHAAEAAGQQGKFWEMHRQLYQTQAAWSKAAEPRALFAGYAQGLGLDVERWRRDMDGAEADARVVADHERGRSLGVTGTPTFFLNGREIEASKLKSPADLRAALEAALAGKSF